MIVLEARNLSIGYGSATIASNIDIAFATNSVTCLLGPNGIGKTTLFKTLLGLIPAKSGDVFIDEQPLAQLSRPEIARRIAYVPQAHPAEFAYTVLDLVVMGRTAYLGTFATPTKQDYAIAEASLERLGIADLAERDAMRISGGQRQLALIARALAQEARVIVMDEPTASLDLANRLIVLKMVRELAADNRAVVLSTHEPEHAFMTADKVAVLGRKHFRVGDTETVLTSEELSRLYGLALQVETTATGRHVVGPA